eukprot:sb/3464017/
MIPIRTCLEKVSSYCLSVYYCQSIGLVTLFSFLRGAHKNCGQTIGLTSCIGYCCCSIIGNAFLVFVFVKLRRKGSTTDIIFLQLAALDCLSSFAGLFGSIFLVNERRWFDEDNIVGDIICYMAGISWNMASLTTPLLLSSASIGRLLAVYLPFVYEKIFKLSLVRILIAICWGVGFLGATISVYTGKRKDCLSSFAGLFGSIFLVNERRWFDEDNIVGDIICYMAGISWNMASLTTPLLLSSASIGRLLAVYLPFVYEKIFKLSLVRILIAICWGVGFLGATISVYTGKRKVIYVALFTLPVILSCGTIISCNMAVAVKIAVMKFQGKQPDVASRPSQGRASLVAGQALTRMKNLNKSAHHLRDRMKKQFTRGATGMNLVCDAETGNIADTKTELSARDKKLAKQRRRENQAILMTILLSCNYFLCYIEIIHYYVVVSFQEDWEQSYIVIFSNVTYVYLWYYFSLFFAAGINPLLHYSFNPKNHIIAVHQFVLCAFRFDKNSLY